MRLLALFRWLWRQGDDMGARFHSHAPQALLLVMTAGMAVCVILMNYALLLWTVLPIGKGIKLGWSSWLLAAVGPFLLCYFVSEVESSSWHFYNRIEELLDEWGFD